MILYNIHFISYNINNILKSLIPYFYKYWVTHPRVVSITGKQYALQWERRQHVWGFRHIQRTWDTKHTSLRESL